jgi:hypothetical protein
MGGPRIFKKVPPIRPPISTRFSRFTDKVAQKRPASLQKNRGGGVYMNGEKSPHTQIDFSLPSKNLKEQRHEESMP